MKLECATCGDIVLVKEGKAKKLPLVVHSAGAGDGGAGGAGSQARIEDRYYDPPRHLLDVQIVPTDY